MNTAIALAKQSTITPTSARARIIDALDAIAELPATVYAVFWRESFPDGEATFRAWVEAHPAYAINETKTDAGHSVEIMRTSDFRTIATFRVDMPNSTPAEIAANQESK